MRIKSRLGKAGVISASAAALALATSGIATARPLPASSPSGDIGAAATCTYKVTNAADRVAVRHHPNPESPVAKYKYSGDFVSGNCDSFTYSASYVYAEVSCPSCPADADRKFWMRWHSTITWYLDKQGV
jgi:hypothetical protein